MEYTLEDKYKLIYEDIINNKSKNPLEIVRDIMKRDYMNIHGPEVINKMSKIGGPRCCKRNAYLSIINAVVFVKEKYDIKMEIDNKTCEFSDLNKQCIKEKCPFYKG